MATYTYSIAGDFYSRMPDKTGLKADIALSSIVAALTEIYFTGDVVEFEFVAPLSGPEVITLGNIITSAKYGVELHANYDTIDVKAFLHQGIITIGPGPLLSVNSAAAINTNAILTPFGSVPLMSELNAQVIVSKAGYLRDFTAYVSVAIVALGATRSITVRKNGVDTTLTIIYPTGVSGSLSALGTTMVPVSVGDLISIGHTVAGTVIASDVIATVNIV